MSKFKDLTQGFLSALDPKPNPYMEEAKALLGGLDPASKAQVLAQLAIAEEINQLAKTVASK
jgi:hypothetical protein